MTTAVEFTFDLSVYRMSAIKKAAYRFAAHYAVEIRPTAGGCVQVVLSPRLSCPPNAPDADSLPSEVLDQDLRETVADETNGIRDVLLAQAFSSLSVVDPVGETADFHDDPLGIGRCNSDG